MNGWTALELKPWGTSSLAKRCSASFHSHQKNFLEKRLIGQWEAAHSHCIHPSYLSPQWSHLALASEACLESQVQVHALVSSPSWWQLCRADWIGAVQIKARICNVRSVFTGEKTKISDMLISHSPGPRPGPGNTSKATPSLLFMPSLAFWLHSPPLTSQTMRLLCSLEKEDNYLHGQVPGVTFPVSNYCVVKRLKLCLKFVFLLLLLFFKCTYYAAARQQFWASLSAQGLQLCFELEIHCLLLPPNLESHYIYISAKKQGQISGSEVWTMALKFPFLLPNPSRSQQWRTWEEWQWI